LTDTAGCLDNVIVGFRERRTKAESQSIKGQLAAVAGDDDRQKALLRELQARSTRPAAVG
jgi:hypothetical protein